MKDLTTLEAILEWARSHPTSETVTEENWNPYCDQAAYLARAVRIAEAYDAAMGNEQGPIASNFLLGHLHAAAEGEPKMKRRLGPCDYCGKPAVVAIEREVNGEREVEMTCGEHLQFRGPRLTMSIIDELPDSWEEPK